jgi:HK97 family phage portal protein
MWSRIRRLVNRVLRRSVSYSVLIPSQAEGKPAKEGENFDNITAGGLYEKLATVYAGVYAIQHAIASVPWRTFRQAADGELEELPDHELTRLLEHPNRNDTGYDLMESTAAFLEIGGESFWLLEGGQAMTGGVPETITPLKPSRVSPLPDRETKVRGYEYDVEGRKIKFLRDEIIHLRYFSPNRDFRGQGSVEPASMAALVDLWAVAFNAGFFKRGATLSGILKSPEQLDPATLRKLVEEFRQEHTGSERAWDIKGLSHDLDFKSVQPSHADMLFEQLRRMNREEILMALGVPPVMVTLLDGATYANAQEQKRQFWELTIVPKLKKLGQRLTQDLAVRYGDDLVLMADLSGIAALQADRVAIATAAVPMVTTGILVRNEVRQWLSTGQLPVLLPLEGGDEALLPFNLMPGGGLPFSAPKPEPKPIAPERGSSAVDRLLEEVQKGSKALRRQALWRIFDRNVQVWARVFVRVAQQMFAEQEDALLRDLEEVLARAKKGRKQWSKAAVTRGVDEIELIIRALFEGNRDRFNEVYAQALAASGGAALENMGITDLDFNIQSPDVLEFIKREGAKLVTEVDDVTIDRLKTTIAEGIAEGESVSGLSDRIKEVMEFANRTRANTIARTEAIKSFNFGAIEGYKQTGGLVDRKRWLATPGGKAAGTRPTHTKADGQVVGLNDDFVVGGCLLKFPGDPAGGCADETINCRCTVEPILTGEAEDVGLSAQEVETNGRP